MTELILFEMAQELQSAGLKWNPQEGDWAYEPDGRLFCYDGCYEGEPMGDCDPSDCHERERAKMIQTCVFAPSLGQMCDRIEVEAYGGELGWDGEMTAWFDLNLGRDKFKRRFLGVFREDAVAEALKRILQRTPIDE